MVSTQFQAQVKVFRTDNGVARSLKLDMSVPHHLWGHAVFSATYLINRTPSRVLDCKIPHDVFGDHVSPVSVSKLPPKVFGCVAYVHVYSHQRSKLDPCALRCVFIGYSSTQKGYKCYHPPTQKVHVTLDVTFYEEVPYYVSPSSPIQGERGSELESLGLENDVFENTALRKETTYRTEQSDRLPISEDGTCGPCEETSDHLLELDRLPISGDEVGALDVETTGHTEASDQSPVYENNDSDSCMDEFNAIPPSALPVPQSTRDSESSEDALSNPKWMDAINVEMDALNKNKTWDLVPLPRGEKAVGCRWVFTLKHKADGSIDLSVVSQFMHSPSEDHMGAVMCISRYLKVTPGKGLMFCKYGHTDVEGYTDAYWAGSVTDRRSTSGYFTFVGGNLVTWRSKKQRVVSRSSAEAKYRGMTQGVYLGFGPRKPMDLYCD
ncbi:unnamed protein product, partial [Prunus brigantina]